MNSFIEGTVTIALAIVGLAMLSVLVSRRSQTPAVIQSAATGFNTGLAVAMSPVTGIDTAVSLAYPNNMGFQFGY